MVKKLAYMVLSLVTATAALDYALNATTSGAASIWSGPKSDEALKTIERRAALDNKGSQIQPRLKWLALETLRNEPLSPHALTVLATQPGKSIDGEGRKALLDISGHLSRRDLSTHFAVLKESVKRNDWDAAIKSIDLALSTSSKSREALFPLLLNGISDTRFRSGIAKSIRGNAPWVLPFVNFALANQTDPQPLTRLLLEAGGAKALRLEAPVSAAMISQLAAKENFELARQLVATVPGYDAAALGRVALDSSTTDARFGAFAWRPVTSSGMIGEINQSTGPAGPISLSLTAEGGISGEAFQKILFLASGAYDLSAEVTADNEASRGEIGIEVRCADGRHALLSNARLSPTLKATRIGLLFSVSRDCPFQAVRILASGGQSQFPVGFMVKNLALQRMMSDNSTAYVPK